MPRDGIKRGMESQAWSLRWSLPTPWLKHTGIIEYLKAFLIKKTTAFQLANGGNISEIGLENLNLRKLDELSVDIQKRIEMIGIQFNYFITSDILIHSNFKEGHWVWIARMSTDVGQWLNFFNAFNRSIDGCNKVYLCRGIFMQVFTTKEWAGFWNHWMIISSFTSFCCKVFLCPSSLSC